MSTVNMYKIIVLNYQFITIISKKRKKPKKKGIYKEKIKKKNKNYVYPLAQKLN